MLFEGYYNGYDRESVNTSFSTAKSITSLLVGIAIDEGLIHDLDDPLTRYVPELADRDAGFAQITLRSLLDMKSGIAFRDHDLPWGDKPRAYYHPHLRHVLLRELRVAEAPGTRWRYNTYNPILLGLMLERATGETVSEFTSSRLWRRLGMEFPATWSVDGDTDPIEKMESGVNARAVDFAKLGRLVLRRGDWNGQRIVSEQWVDESVTPPPGCALADFLPQQVCHHHAWWLHPASGEQRLAIGAWGHLGQYIYVFPNEQMVLVRFGRKLGGVSWPGVFRAVVGAVTDHTRPARSASRP
jgi:CubicO group peptidase (beta-lactamase class C family)